jgi:hypothetical protein
MHGWRFPDLLLFIGIGIGIGVDLGRSNPEP